MIRSAAPKRRLLWLVALLLSTVGCVRGCPSSRPPIHVNPNMDVQPKYKAQASSDFFYDGMTMRTPVEGTVARDGLTVVDNSRLAVAPDEHLGDASQERGGYGDVGDRSWQGHPEEE